MAPLQRGPDVRRAGEHQSHFAPSCIDGQPWLPEGIVPDETDPQATPLIFRSGPLPFARSRSSQPGVIPCGPRAAGGSCRSGPHGPDTYRTDTGGTGLRRWRRSGQARRTVRQRRNEGTDQRHSGLDCCWPRGLNRRRRCRTHLFRMPVAAARNLTCRNQSHACHHARGEERASANEVPRAAVVPVPQPVALRTAAGRPVAVPVAVPDASPLLTVRAGDDPAARGSTVTRARRDS